MNQNVQKKIFAPLRVEHCIQSADDDCNRFIKYNAGTMQAIDTSWQK